MWKIIDGLYLAQFPMVVAPRASDNFKKNNIKRVLTLTTEEIPESFRVENVDYHFIHMLDLDEQEILERGILMKSYRICAESIKNDENVVVHCVAGVSRSVTICMAYLMKSLQISVEESLEIIRKIRPNAQPNDGFIGQLKLFQRSNYDLHSENYRRAQIVIERFGDESMVLYKQPIDSNPEKMHFKCKKCRKVLFNSENLIEKKDEACSELHIEPMQWLNVKQHVEKITHACGAKIGTFEASGQRCPGCNCFFKPWIHVLSNKIDRCVPNS